MTTPNPRGFPAHEPGKYKELVPQKQPPHWSYDPTKKIRQRRTDITTDPRFLGAMAELEAKLSNLS